MPGMKTIYSRDGTPLTDIRAAVTRSSLLNDIGEAVFSISTSDVKCRRDVLEYGNFLYCQHDSLPDWVGIIDTPRTWGNGYVEIHAFEVPYLLAYRLPILNSVITGTPGAKFLSLLEYANTREDTLLRAGDVFLDGISGTEILDSHIYYHLKRLSDIYKNDWLCTPVISAAGKMTINMDWLQKAGITTDLELSQGVNVLYGDAPLEESGELINYVEGVSDTGDENGTNVLVTNFYQSSNYGLREKRVSFSGITNMDTLLNNCTALVKEQIEPSYGTPLTVANVGAAFANIRLGNIVRYKYTNVGFDGSGLGASRLVRILGYRFDEALNTCELYTGKA